MAAAVAVVVMAAAGGAFCSDQVSSTHEFYEYAVLPRCDNPQPQVSFTAEARHIAILQPKRAPMPKESDHSANLSKAREMLLVERRQLAAELTKSYQRGDGEKRERFMVVQSMIEAIDRAALDEARIARGEDPVPTVTHYGTEKPSQIPGQ